MDRDDLVEITPHYVAILLLVFLVLSVVGPLLGDVSFWLELVIILVIAFLYRFVVVRLGVAPTAWKRE